MDNFVPPGRCCDPGLARRWVRDLVAAQGWRRDRAAAYEAVLTQLVWSMDWESGLVTAVTDATLAAGAARSTRTVSRVKAWAIEAGLLHVAEKPASAAFLGTTRGRTTTYALYRPAELPAPLPDPLSDDQDPTSVDLVCCLDDGPHSALATTSPATPPTREKPLLGDLPLSLGEHYPSQAQGRKIDRAARGQARPDGRAAGRWPLFASPGTASERERALDRVLGAIGISPATVPARARWQARGLLRCWWDAGLCPAGVLHALAHHPDLPGRDRGTLTCSRDPVAVLGARMRPWRGRLAELPVAVTGHRVTPAADAITAAAPGVPGAGGDAGEQPVAARSGHRLESAPGSRPAPGDGPGDAVGDVPSAAAGWEPTASARHRARLRAGFRAEQILRRSGRATHPGPHRPNQ